MLHLQNISKSFPGVKALQNVTLSFDKGMIHAICGENGAGKSTLMNIIMGIHQPDAGIIKWNGNTEVIRSVSNAYALGISIVYQERSLVDSLSIAENIYPVRMPVKQSGIIDFESLYEQTNKLLIELGLGDLSPKTLVGRLSTPQKQMVEIAKAIAQEPALLILDEPTASLTHSETAILFRILQKLKSAGVGIIYISHRMAEIQLIADQISILKDGKFVETVDGKTPANQIIRLMVGRDLEDLNPTNHVQAHVILEVQHISGKGFSDVSFRLHKGEILGFAGLQGSGRSALAKALFGDQRIMKGKLLKNGRELQIRHPSEAIAQRIVYLPEDRKQEGLFLQKPVFENLFSVNLEAKFYDRSALLSKSEKICTDYKIRAVSAKEELRKLSGGNQQKTMLAKWMNLDPEIIIVNEPTHGVDVGSKAEIYHLLKKLTAQGKSILLISSELSELLLLCDRIAVMHEGKVEAILDHSEASEEKITALASGLNEQ